MAIKTINYNLIKPEENEYYGVDVSNGNMDIIDTELKKAQSHREDTGVHVSTYIHTKIGTVHNLQGNGNHIEFIATADNAEGDTWSVNGQSVSATLQNGEPLPDDLFKTGNWVTGVRLDGTKLGFKSAGGVKLNIFCQLEEPEIKDGIWIKCSDNFTDIIVQPNFVVSGLWDSPILYPSYSYSLPSSKYHSNVESLLINGSNLIFAEYQTYSSGNVDGDDKMGFYYYMYIFNMDTKTYTKFPTTLLSYPPPSSYDNCGNYGYLKALTKSSLYDAVFFTTRDHTDTNNRATYYSWICGIPNISGSTIQSTSVYGLHYSYASSTYVPYSNVEVYYSYVDKENNKIMFVTVNGYSSDDNYSDAYAYGEYDMSSEITTSLYADIPVDIGMCYPIDDTNVLFIESNGTIKKLNKTTRVKSTLLVAALTEFSVYGHIGWHSKNEAICGLKQTASSTYNYLGIYNYTENSWSYITLPYSYSSYSWKIYQSTLYGFNGNSAAGYNIAIDLVTHTITDINGNGGSNYSIVLQEDGENSRFISVIGSSSSYGTFQPRVYQLSQVELNEGSLAILDIDKYKTNILNRQDILRAIKKYSTDVLKYDDNFSTPYSFYDAWLFRNGKYQEYPSYYGNGTQWIKFKN